MQTTNNTLSLCKSIAFGKVTLNNEEIEIYRKLNDEIPSLCKKLSRSVQTEAMLFLMNYSGLQVGQPWNFYEKYYVPAWSIIYWITKITRTKKELSPEKLDIAIKAQAMALFLHSLDDHLHEGHIPVSHTMLHLRSQTWMILRDSLNMLAVTSESRELINTLIDDYYSSISLTEDNSLENYFEIFKKQMSTWYIIPMLTAMNLSDNHEFVNDIGNAFRIFMIAWRIIDDLNDITEDIIQGSHTTPYLLLPEEGKNIWDNMAISCGEITDADTIENSSNMNIICNMLKEETSIEKIINRTYSELKTAADIAYKHGMKGLSEQYREMGIPLKIY